MDWEFGFAPVGVFGFVILIVLIGSLFSYLKTRSAHETIRTLAASGRDIDPSLLRGLETEGGSGWQGFLTGGTITLAVAVALVIFGQQLGTITGDDEVGPVFRAVAVFPGLIGAALLLMGLISAIAGRGRGADNG
ncbi:MAG: hypothetical protein AAGH41_04380 [Pseudomonadota bacterium]